MNYKLFDSLSPDAAKIRSKVFIEEQGFTNEFDSTDNNAKHLVAYDGDMPVAACRFFADSTDDCYIIGRIAVLKEYRGKNIGSKLLKKAEQYIRSYGIKEIRLHAQTQAVHFYNTLGYTGYGNVDYDEDCPHIWMCKRINS